MPVDGGHEDRFPLGEGPRYQPEFSTGERLATLEAGLARAAEDRGELQSQIDRRLGESEKLFNEKLDGISREVQAKADAQKAAVDKAEQSSTRQFESFVAQNDQKSEITQRRLSALERGESAGQERRNTANELKTSTLAVIGALATIALVILYVAHP